MGFYNCPDQGHKDVVVLCGSTRFKRQFEEINKELTLAGKIVLSVGCYGHLMSPEEFNMMGEIKNKLNLLHMKKIDLASEVYIINPTGYIGSSTKREIEYAVYMRRKIKFYSVEKENAELTSESFPPKKWANTALNVIYWDAEGNYNYKNMWEEN